eukprot:2493798-Rhodomonas_salina.1
MWRRRRRMWRRRRSRMGMGTGRREKQRRRWRKRRREWSKWQRRMRWQPVQENGNATVEPDLEARHELPQLTHECVALVL